MVPKIGLFQYSVGRVYSVYDGLRDKVSKMINMKRNYSVASDKVLLFSKKLMIFSLFLQENVCYGYLP